MDVSNNLIGLPARLIGGPTTYEPVQGLIHMGFSKFGALVFILIFVFLVVVILWFYFKKLPVVMEDQTA